MKFLVQAFVCFLLLAFSSNGVQAQQASKQALLEAEESGIEHTVQQAQTVVAPRKTQSLPPVSGLLLIPESTNDRVMAFDATTGDLVDADFIPADPTNLSTPIHVLPLLSGGFLVSDQLDDVVQEYDGSGAYIGVFAPAGGVNTAILDNIRGMAFAPNGNLLVTVGDGANDDAVAEFDASGNYVGNRIANGAGGLDSPFDVIVRSGDFLVGGITSDAVHRYDFTGAYLGDLSAINTFPEQLFETAGGNILVANFFGTDEGVVEYTSAGALVGIYDPPSLGGYRGVYELPNGNILTTNGGGVHEIDQAGNLVETKIAGVSARFITLWTGGVDLGVNKTTSDDAPQVDDEIDFTITVTNNGPEDATNVTVNDLPPPPLSFVSSSATQGNYNEIDTWTVGDLLNGQSATLVITTLINGTSPFPVTNTATVSGDQDDPNDTNDSDSVVLTIQSADLSIRKRASPTVPGLGENFNYTLTVCHVSGIPAFGIRVTDILPDGVTFVSASGDYDPVSGIYQFGDLAHGDPCRIETITVTLNALMRITNRADISFSSTPDPNLSNNSSSVTVNGQAADLELAKRATNFVQVDGTSVATFEVTVTNNGPSTANSIVVGDMFSPEATINFPVMISQGGLSFPVNGVEWAVGTLANRASATMTMTMTAPANSGIINVAEVISSDRQDPDSTPNDGVGDDYDAALVGVRDNPDFVRGLGPGGIIDRGGRRFAADLSLTKTVDNTTPTIDSDVVYTITVNNAGPQLTAGVEVTDVLPAGVAFVTATASQGAYYPMTGVWEVGAMSVGSTATLEITTTVTGSGTITNVAEVTASNLPDPDSFFNFFDDDPEIDDKDDASVTVQSASAKAAESVEGVVLGSGYPNPFNPEAVIPFALGEASQVRLAVYDMLGRQVALLVEGQVSAGRHEVVFSGATLPTGVYLVRMEAQGVVQTQRITLMK